MSDFIDAYKTLLVVAGALGTGFAIVLFTYKSYRLLRGTFIDHAFGRRRTVIGTLLKALAYVLKETAFQRKPPTFYECIRIRAEHEIFSTNERSAGTHDQFGDMTIGDANTPGEQRRKLNAGDVNDAFDRIRKYFRVLREIDPQTELKFLCTLTIETGFVSPIHLLAGLLSRFEEAWPKIVRAYDQDVGDNEQAAWMALIRGADETMPDWIVGFRKIQKFNFDCWLQWGPSIPNSASSADLPLTSIQYGFGDENNSIELVGSREKLKAEMKELWKDWQGMPWRPYAMPARVRGRITHSAVLAEPEKKNVSDVLLKSWGDEGRILLMPGPGTDAMIGKTKNGGYYYSAYIWVMFVAMIKHADNRPYQPLHRDDGRPDLTSHPWLDLFPFFEHCNIACPAALLLIKQQLALKAVTGIKRLVDAAAPKPFPLRFMFSCAIDEPGAKERLWLDELKEPDPKDKSLRTLILELAPQFPDLFSAGDPIINLGRFDPAGAGPWPYSTHKLVDHVNDVSNRIERA